MSIRSVSKSWTRSNLIGLLVFIAFIGILPLWVRTPYALSNMVLIGIYSLVTIGLCLLMGYAGQISLGQAAFFGLGAYGSGILTVHFGWSPWIALVIAALLTAVVAYLIGIPIFRLRSHYLAMGTLAFGAIVTIVMNEWRLYTGGPTGLPGIPRLTLGAIPIKSDIAYYYLAWGTAIIGLIIALNLVRSRFGRALRAIHDSEPAAQSLGVDVTRHKLVALVISAIYARVAGSLYAHYIIFISPNAFDFGVSVRLVLMVAVGGLASIWGAPFGTAGVILLTMALREIAPLLTRHGSGEHQIIAYGVLLVVIMIFMPDGLTVALVRAWRRLWNSETLHQRLRAYRRRP